MRNLGLIVAIAILMAGYGPARAGEVEPRRFSQSTIQVDQQASGIGISSYTLITDDATRNRRDATEIMPKTGSGSFLFLGIEPDPEWALKHGKSFEPKPPSGSA